LYETQTQPLIDYYGQSGRMFHVDGVGSPDDVFDRLTKVIEGQI
jgi:adenylate kinase